MIYYFLKNYEESFFWFIKRDYFFKTLPAYNSFAKLFLNNVSSELSELAATYPVHMSYLLKAPLRSLAFSLNQTIFTDYKLSNVYKSDTFLNKDLFLSFQEKNLLNTQNVDLLYLLTLTTFSGDYSYLYFNALVQPTTKLSVNTFFTEKSVSTFTYNYWFLLNCNILSKSYLVDFYYFLFL